VTGLQLLGLVLTSEERDHKVGNHYA
jgi:hypothetical protein